jgi:uncharacterized protein YdiU (UPF0061 family)
MNTDNMAVSGETIDYGPCAFMDAYAPNTVFSSIDRQGRYAYGNQPAIAQWNLARFAETLMPVLHTDEEKSLALAEEGINGFPEMFHRFWISTMRAKLGLFTEETDDRSLIQDLLSWMHENHKDYTNTCRALSSKTLPRISLDTEPGFLEWYSKWQARLARQPQPVEAALHLMRENNPAEIPRNHMVEEALKAAGEGDFEVMKKLLTVLAAPYNNLKEHDIHYSLPPEPSNISYKTFCGT